MLSPITTVMLATSQMSFSFKKMSVDPFEGPEDPGASPEDPQRSPKDPHGGPKGK
jgi:hypothetical protein